MILLFTDFGASDLYTGQVKTVLRMVAPGVEIVDLLHEVPNFNVRAGAHLLAALNPRFPKGNVFLAVVDPGVGGSRGAVVLQAAGNWFVGPDNGLLSVVAGRAEESRVWRIVWRPEVVSRSFHGRDIFAPIAGAIAAGDFPADKVQEADALGVLEAPADLAEIIYVDHYGNAMTGLRAATCDLESRLIVADRALSHANVFSEVAPGVAFWYENSLGLVEVAVNMGSAAEQLGLRVSQPIQLRRD